MAFGRLERVRRDAPLSESNMTPLIDVMLVLLVIFMITAPLMSSSLRLQLPQVEGATPPDAPVTLDVSIDAHGTLYIAEQALAPAAFRERLARAAHDQPQADVQLRADRDVPYGRVAQVIGLLQAAGLTRIGFVAVPGAPTPP